MVTKDGLSFRITTYDNDDLFAEEYRYFNDAAAFGEKLAINWTEGGRFLKLIPSPLTDTYSKLLSRSKKIEKDLYQFYLGEYPQVRVSKEISSILTSHYNDCDLMMTGKTYMINHKIYPEYIYNNKKYINYDGYWIQVLPIKWIINEKEKKIISSQVLTTHRSYSDWPLDEEIMQCEDDSKEELNIANKMFVITNGVLVKYDPIYGRGLSSIVECEHRIVYLPYGIKKIDNVKFYLAEYLRFPKSVEKCTFDGKVSLNGLEVYDNIYIADGVLYLKDWLQVHYDNYDNLISFLNKIYHSISSGCSINCYIIGPRLTRTEKRQLKEYSFIRKVYWNPEKVEENNNSDELLDSGDTKKEERKEENRAKLLLDKIYKYLENYPNYDKYKEQIDKLVNDYESILDTMQSSFINQDNNLLSSSPDDAYNSFCMMLEGILSKLERNNEYYLMIEYIDKCIKAFNGELNDDKNLLLSTLNYYGSVSLEILKEPIKKDYFDKIMAILMNEKGKIQRFIEEDYNNKYGKKEFTYLDTGELESYLRRELYPFFEEITYAVNSEELSRNLQKEALVSIADMANSKIVESENSYIKSQISLISRINKGLDSLIDKSPFADKFRKDKEIIMSYVSENEDESKDYLKDLISKCNSLSKYNEDNDELFMPKYIHRMNDSLKSVHSENGKFLNIIKKLQSVIVVLDLLELEVNNSIIENDKYNKYRVGRR